MKKLLPVLLLIASLSSAHEDLSEQVREITAKILQNPGDPVLYFERAELLRGDAHWSEAEQDYLRAKELSPKMIAIDLGLGLLYYDTKRFADSRTALDQFLTKKPDHFVARVTRARVLKSMNQVPGAIEDYSQALRIQPDPAVYIERADLLALQKKPEEALSGLDEGISKLGPVVTLELCAIELETQLKRYDSAIIRIDRIAAQSQRKESWFVRRAEILRLASRNTEARECYLQALDAINALPEVRRRTPYTQDLQKRIQKALEELATNPLQ